MTRIARMFKTIEQRKIHVLSGKAEVIEHAKSHGRVLAVPGKYDHLEQVVPHLPTGTRDLVDRKSPPPNLSSYDVLIVGCPGALPLRRWRDPINEFLRAGGVMVTSDWCLHNMIEKLFPGTIRNRGSAWGKYPLRVWTPGHPLLDGLSDLNGTRWVVKAWSQRIEVNDPRRVQVVLDAPKMRKENAILVCFSVGAGLVVHAISHFCLQGSDERGNYVSAFILTNAIDDAMWRKHHIGVNAQPPAAGIHAHWY